METKTDRELLELAAKSVGIRWFEDCAMWVGNCRTGWNPLLDDGDALRLAVKLQLTVCNDQVASGYAYCTNRDEDDKFPAVHSGKNEDEVIAEDYAATRRAIVRAAARIGESK